ncbi:hypothetical protein RB628_27400 [Streptomyces sp. ADMS]|uniref:hypothetical protein n=1 Tax=Streptomyces sp. ADMS TaxID=3071415 RepID=UPI00296F3836|nr:hypothetical protein [Streptomyces sp. ADMS]MDW4908963.1 hypothetical protein [Streptomyces sp. ADMS]
MSVAGPCVSSRKDTALVLASLAVGWLWLMATAATVVHCSAMAKWIPLPKFRTVYPVIIVGCGIGAVAVGRFRGFELTAMLALYAFALIGLTIGLLPSRKLFMTYAREIGEGVTREKYDIPSWQIVFCVFAVIAMLVAAFALTR